MNCCKLTLLTLCLLALVLRVGAVLELHSWRDPNAMEHKSIAVSLINGNGFSFYSFDHPEASTIQSPPYPLLLAACFKIFGVKSAAAYIAAMMVNCLAGAAVVWLTYLMVGALGGGPVEALLAAALVTVWPMQIYACTVAQAVVLITAAITAVMGLFYISVQSGRLAPWIAFSLAGTLAALTEPAFLPAVALAGLIIFFCRNLSIGVRIRNATVLLIAAMMVMGPWALRNRMVIGAWVPVKGTFWVNAWKGNNPHATGSDRISLTADQEKMLSAQMNSLDDSRVRDFDQGHQYAMLTSEQRKQLHGKSEQQREVIFKEFTMSWIRANPGDFARLCGVRLAKTVWIDWDNPKSYNRVYVISRAALLLTGAIGLVLALRRRWSLGYPALIYLSTLLLYAVTITAARFAIPFEPLMLSFSALALAELWRAMTGRCCANAEKARATM